MRRFARCTPLAMLAIIAGCASARDGAVTLTATATSSSTVQIDYRPSLQIRCGSTVGHEAILVVDGVVLGLRPDSTIDHEQVTAATRTINPADIESVEVLKGPIALKRYGPGAHAGVVIITMKKPTTHGS